MRAPVLLLLLVACATSEREERVKEIAATTFREMLQCGDPAMRNQSRCDSLRDDVVNIESVRVEPRANGSARYVITSRSSQIKNVAYAEYPGKILDEMTAAGVLYTIKPRD